MHSSHETIFAQEIRFGNNQLWHGGESINGQAFGKMRRDEVGVGYSSTRSPTEGKPQRGILGFYQGFGEAGAVVDQDDEIHCGIIRERTIDRVNRSQGQGL
ncbi:hypothetical protein BvCmsOUP088_02237 [Escherichia coli]|nr:hypothetical protein EC1303_c08830 [Escherichia coli 1303]SQM53640.1 Uncharacterised protein [Escherichia coli]GCG83401.1 hypothetical protein BvCms27BK_00427 [Escherichia coli]GCJ34409.1 hypothetical protein BvCmsL119A_04259 [Escherichia coli]GCK49020.1 hypothetical protein BvCmsC8A_00799 [Escherichia coli]